MRIFTIVYSRVHSVLTNKREVLAKSSDHAYSQFVTDHDNDDFVVRCVIEGPGDQVFRAAYDEKPRVASSPSL